MANPSTAERDRLIAQYMPLVKHVVGRIMVNLPEAIDQDDLLSQGYIGLLQAFEKYDASRGIKFETFAIPRIRGAVLDELRNQDWLPRSLRQKTKAIERAMERLENELGRPAGDEEIAKSMDLPVEEVRQTLADANVMVLSLDYVLSPDDEGGTPLESLVPDKEGKSPTHRMEQKELKEALAQAIEALPPREKLLIGLYYQEGLTMKEIGKVLEVTEARVCQLHAQAVMRIRLKLQAYL